MLTQISLLLNIFICLVALVVLAIKRIYPAATIFLSLGLVSMIGLSAGHLSLIANPEELLSSYKILLPLQTTMTFGFYYYTKTIFRDNSEIYKGPGFWVSAVLALSLWIYSFVAPVDQLIFSPDYAQEKIVYLTHVGFSVYLFLMLYLVFGLVQLERTFSGLHSLQRWQIKAEVVGSGLLLAALGLFYSHSLLYRSLDMNFVGLRTLAAIVAIAIICYGRMFRTGADRLALSRGIAHRSFVLLIVGGYLILLGILGEGLRYLDVDNFKPIFYGILLIGGCFLALFFLSERLRRRLKVTLHKNFYQSKYDYREQWKLFTERVAAHKTLKEIEPAILDLFCENLACKGAALYLQDAETSSYEFSSSFNYRRDWRPFPLNDSLIRLMDQEEWVIDLAESSPELSDSMISTFSDAGAFLVVPLHFDGELVGFIVIGERINSSEEMTYEDYDLLRMLARQSVATIQGIRLSEQLSVSRELAAIGKLSTFVLHDLKNQVSGLSLMLDNAKDYMDDPEFQEDMLDTVETTVKNMKGLIGRLKNVKEKPQLAVSKINLEDVIRDAVETAGGGIEVVGRATYVPGDNDEIYKVILNLLMNAKEATKNGDAVLVEYGQNSEEAFMNVIDHGCGMSQEFIREKLFKPFETTKKFGFGIGLYQCRQIIEAHEGTITAESSEGQGTTFMIKLPVAS